MAEAVRSNALRILLDMGCPFLQNGRVGRARASAVNATRLRAGYGASTRRRFVEKAKIEDRAHPIDSSKGYTPGRAMVRQLNTTSQFSYRYLQLTLVKQSAFTGLWSLRV